MISDEDRVLKFFQKYKIDKNWLEEKINKERLSNDEIGKLINLSGDSIKLMMKYLKIKRISKSISGIEKMKATKNLPEQKKKMSDMVSGRKNPMFGKKLTVEQLKKISATSKKLWEDLEYRTSQRNRMLGDKNPNWKGGITALYE